MIKTVTMTYEQYLEECFKVQARYQSWRLGQTLFNVLSEQRPDLANKINGTELDPFYAVAPSRHTTIDAFLTYVRQNW